MESTTTSLEAEDEWELCNDDGFVYKRKKRRLTDPAAAAPPPPATDPQAEEESRRERKRKALLKLKSQFQREIDHWEYLSNTLREMQEKTLQFQNKQQEREHEMEQTACFSGSTPLAVQGSDDACGSLIDELLLQVECQEAIMHDVSNLCDVAKAMADAQEEQLNKSYFDLPIWGSPRELMASLCDD